MPSDDSTKVSEPPSIGYLGPPGTFTEQALLSQDDLRHYQLVAHSRFVDTLEATSTGQVDFGLVAIENAIEGTVNMTLDALAFDYSLFIQREVELDINLQLMAAPGVSFGQIVTVMSHPVAMAQCRKFLHRQLPDATIKPANSTSEAARIAAEDPTVAAIGPELAAEINGLELLAKDVADHPGNRTRFVVVARSGIPASTGHDKTTVVLTEHTDAPGTLVAMLQEFAARSINLTRLSSRPVKNKLGQYCFIVDFVGHIADDVVADCLRSIRAKHAEVKFLGSYSSGDAVNGSDKEAIAQSWQEASDWVAKIQALVND